MVYLKRIEIQGFKSFAERVVIEFDKGITVIVGPNGCGKSNLTDAVKWVLGEQSARSLRGYRMDDVIFSGTSRRRPLGMAEVSLTFDNSDQTLPLPYQEVNITRRVYRSGEGEYLINKNACRLRDIQELFAQCGISRAAFSISSQGKIDEFIMVPPQERRLFLEDMAGVRNYRQRKYEALRKLEETEESLVRIRDLLAELEKRRIPLQKQAEIAEQYQRLLQLCRLAEQRLLEGQLAGIRHKEELLLNECEKIKSSFSFLESGFTLLEKDLEDFKLGLAARRKSIEQQSNKLDELGKTFQELNSAYVRLEEKMASSENRKKELKARLAVILERKKETKEELAELEAACERLRELQLGAQQILTELEEEKRAWEEEKKLTNRAWEDIDQEIFDVIHRKTSLVSEVRVLKNKIEVLSRQQESINKKSTAAKRQLEELQKDIQTVEEKCRESEAVLAEKSAELATEENRLEFLLREQEKLSAKLYSLSQQINRYQERFRILKEAENHHEGYQQGVKKILQAAAAGVRFNGELLVLTEELLQIDPVYGAALDAALGRAAHYFICDTPQAAQEAIAFLKKEKGGRASFFPLSTLQYWSSQAKGKIEMVDGFIGRMADLISCDDRYRKLAEYLLGRTYLVDNLKNASIFAEKNKYQYRVVTLQGDLIQAGGLFTGGASKSRFPTTRGRKQELAELEAKMLKYRRQYSQYDERNRKLQIEQEAVEKRIQESRENCKRAEDAWRDNQQQLSIWNQELKKLQEFIENCRLESEELQYRQQELNQQLSELEKDLELVSAREGEVEAKRAELEKIRKESEEKTQDIMSRLSKAQVSFSAFTQDLKHQEQKKQQIRQLLELREQELKKVESDLNVLQDEISAILEQKDQLQQQLAALTIQKNEINETIVFRKKQVAAWERYINARERRYLKIKEILMKAKQRLQNNSMRLQHFREQRDEIFRKAAEDNLRLDQVNPKILKRKEENELKDEVTLLKKQMTDLGEVNFAAPGEYLEINERIDNLKQQVADLEEGKRSLTKMIADFDRVAAAKFKKTYQEVRSNFQEIYHLLSNGGEADLTLTDNNMLETGIDICVVPRGKKPRHLSLLSGGEKALTGISFLFAMLQSNPSPFYLLDEIDAFLDEANLIRFASFLRKWSVGHQLILISHRYHTMEIADHLFGVTMDEPGVSRIVSVELSEYAPENNEQYIS
ncbi:MAG: chromosome segregation protein SMC [Thermacetogeniaceae bacterium]